MKLYKGYKHIGPFGRKAPTAAIYAQTSYPVLRLPSICSEGRISLYFDEETFDIHAKIHSKGALKIFSRPHMGNGVRHLVCLQGFLVLNALDYEDVKGVYSVQWVKQPKSFVVLYKTRRKELIVSKHDKRKVTICLSAKEKESWDHRRGQLSMSAFVRSAVNRYLEDRHTY